jgi:hypothetical protein
MRLKEALIIKYLLFNPNSSEAQIASAINDTVTQTGLYLDSLVRDQLVIHINSERKFIINYDSFDIIVEAMRKLTSVEEQLTEFGVDVSMIH